MQSIPRIRIVVGFPADAKHGRQVLAETLASQVFKTLKHNRGVDLELVAWDTHAGPGIHEGGVQGWIDLALNIRDCDLFVAIFRSSLGTPFEKWESGTVYEIKHAIECYREKKEPQVWVCFPSDFKDDSDGKEVSAELLKFIETFRTNNKDYPISYLEYSSWKGLGDSFSEWLFKFILSKADSGNRPDLGGRFGDQVKLFYSVNTDIARAPVESITAPTGCINVAIYACSERKTPFRWQGDIVVYFNTNLTSPSIKDFSLATITVMTTETSTGQWIAQSCSLGKQLGANAVGFQVIVNFESSPSSARLVVNNLFVNATQLGVSSTLQPTMVSAYVAASSSDPEQFLLVANNVQGHVASITPPMEHRLTQTTDLEFRDLTRLIVDGRERIAVVSENHVKEYLSDDFVRCIYNHDLLSSRAFLNSGIRLIFQIFASPNVINYIYVPASVDDGAEAKWHVVNTNANGSGLEPTEVSGLLDFEGVQYLQIPLHRDTAFVVYQLRWYGHARGSRWIGSSLKLRFIGLLNELPFEPVGSIAVKCSLAPISTVTTSSTIAPVPRFADVSTSKMIKWK